MNTEQITVVTARLIGLNFFFSAAVLLQDLTVNIQALVEIPQSNAVSAAMYLTRLVLYIAFGLLFTMRADGMADWSMATAKTSDKSIIHRTVSALVRIYALENLFSAVIFVTFVPSNLTLAAFEIWRPEFAFGGWPFMPLPMPSVLHICCGLFMLIGTDSLARWLTRCIDIVASTARLDSWPSGSPGNST